MGNFETWTKLSDSFPDRKEYVLTHDIWINRKRWNICIGQERKPYLCNDGQTRACLNVYNSICPGVYDDEVRNAHWMYLPPSDDKRWNIVPSSNTYEDYYFKKTLKELGLPDHENKFIAWLHCDSCYVADFMDRDWQPSFSSFKNTQIESIARWIELPEAPNG